MSLKKKEIDFFKKTFKKLETEYGIDPFEDEIEKDTGSIYFPFPKEEEVEVEVEHLMQYFKEIESLKIHDYNKVTTDKITQRVINASELYTVMYLGFFQTHTEDGIELKIVTEPILIGLAASKKQEYSKYHPPCTSNIAVEITYPTKKNRLSNEDEEKLIKSYFFELAHTYKISLSFTTFQYFGEFNEEELEKDMNKSTRAIEDYNPGMDLFIQANQAISDDLTYLSYYKIFEFFAPFYSKIDAFEAMRKKLDSSNATELNAEYIASIFDLTKNYEKSIRDKELVKSLLDNTFDLVDIYDSLPLSIRNGAKLDKLEYKTKKDVKDRVINYLGNVLYSTRNGIVHAKSNFESTGIECSDEDLEQLNQFMHKACYGTIKWYNRLPKHLKIT